MNHNRIAKEKLIELYGAECFIDKLHLRNDTGRHYTGKGQYSKMKRLTYHHIRMKKDGGKATVENGALLSEENHRWFHRQPKDAQERMNQAFQNYKKCKVQFVDELPTEVRIACVELGTNGKSIQAKKLSPERKRRKEKKKFQRIRKEYEDR